MMFDGDPEFTREIIDRLMEAARGKLGGLGALTNAEINKITQSVIDDRRAAKLPTRLDDAEYNEIIAAQDLINGN